MPQQPLTRIPIPNPIGGVMRTKGREEPPEVPALTNALNCLPYDLIGRKRLAQRAGVDPLYNLNTAGADGGLVQGILPVGFIVQPGAFIQPPPALPVNSTNFTPFANMFSTGGLVVGQGPVSTNWVVDPTQPIGLERSLTLTVLSTLVGGATFSVTGRQVVFNIEQDFQIKDIAGHVSQVIPTFSQIEWWVTKNSTSTINGLVIPAPPAGFVTTLFFAGLPDTGTWVLLNSQNFAIGGANMPTQVGGATFTYGINVTSGGWSGVETVNALPSPFSGTLSTGIPNSTGPLSTSLSTPFAPAPFSTSSTFCNLAVS